MKIFLLFLLVFSESVLAEAGVSFKKFAFEDTAGCYKVKYSFTFPASLPNKAALPKLQKNIIKFALGEKYAGYEPETAFRLFLKSDEDETYKCNNDDGYDFFELTGHESFPLPGIVEYSIYDESCFGCPYIHMSSERGIYNIADGKKIEINDIFKKGWEQSVTKLIVKNFLADEQYKDDLGEDDTEEEYLKMISFVPTSKKLSLNVDGLSFVYGRSEIIPTPVVVFLPWKELKPYLNPKSVIYSKIKF